MSWQNLRHGAPVGAAGELSEEPFQGPRVICRDQCLGLPVEDQFALVDDQHPVADALDHIENMRAIDDGLALAGQRLDERLEAHRGVGIQPVQRLVKKDNRRIMQQRAVITTLRRIPFEYAPSNFSVSVGKPRSKKEINCSILGRRLRDGIERRDHLQVFESR